MGLIILPPRLTSANNEKRNPTIPVINPVVANQLN
jgi:hypothetical protein